MFRYDEIAEMIDVGSDDMSFIIQSTWLDVPRYYIQWRRKIRGHDICSVVCKSNLIRKQPMKQILVLGETQVIDQSAVH